MEPFSSSNKRHLLVESKNNSTNEIIFLSDTQSPIWVERIWLNENDNELARRKIFTEILKENSGAVFHLGDLTEFGFRESSWESSDNFIDSLSILGIPFYPTLGNHELLLFPSMGKAKFLKRFPYYSTEGYYVKVNQTAVILLNSNFGDLLEIENKNQIVFFRKTIKALEKDTTIKSIIVGCHHSPFTNSKIVSPDSDVQKEFLEIFFKSKKCKAFISGHAHAFEHFRINNKDFFVVGGGGGLQQPLYVGDEERWEDEYSQTEELRNFHYLKVLSGKDSLFFLHKKLDDTKRYFVEDYKVAIPIN